VTTDAPETDVLLKAQAALAGCLVMVVCAAGVIIGVLWAMVALRGG